MNHLLFLAQGGNAFTDTVNNIAHTFGVDWPHLIAQIISFSIVAFALQQLAFKRILASLADRRARIEEGLANADRIKQELAQTEAARQGVLDRANEEANRLIEEARAAAARVREQETQRAVAAAEEIIAKAREAAAADHARMLTDLKREVGRLVVSTAGMVTGKVLTADDQRRLVEETNLQLTAK
jgi:F-type H+-transporting ATPase subunit b